MFKYNMGGSVPRETNIAGQRHSLAYINPFEEDLLNTQYRGGEGQPVPPFAGPGGVPTYIPDDGNRGKKKDPDANDPRGRDQRNTPRKEIKTLSPGGGPKSTPNRVSSSGTVATSKVDDTFGSGNIFSNPGTGSTTNFGNSGNSGNSGNNDPQPTVNIFGDTNPNMGSGYPISTPASVVTPTSNVSGGPTKTELKAAKDARIARGRSGLESFANSITPNDFMEYNLAGQLVYQKGHPTVEAGKANVGDPVRSDETNSFGFTVGMGNTNTNDATPGMYRGGFGSGVKTDLDMTFAAGFGTPEEQKMELLRAGYTEEMADAYLAQTAATRANMGTGMGGGGGDNNDIVQDLVTDIADPCPEGYKMDPVTNACVIDPDIGIGAPVFTPQDPNAVAGGGGTGYTQPIGNFIPTPLQPNKMNPMQQQLNALTKSLQPQQNQQLAGGLAGIRR